MSQRISDLTQKTIGHSSDIELQEPDSSSSIISVRPIGFNGATAFSLLFTIFWLVFITFWTFSAAMGSIFFASFSIPFWVVGFTMLYGVLTSLFGTQKIEVKRGEIVLTKKSPLRTSQLSVPYNELASIELVANAGRTKNISTTMKLTSSGSVDNGVFSEIPTLFYEGNKEWMFGESLSQRDKKWLVNYLNDRIVPLMKFVR